jgi:hypothetical protein
MNWTKNCSLNRRTNLKKCWTRSARCHEEMVGSVSDTIPNYTECSQEALESQLDATSKAYKMIMTKNNITAKDDETERCKIQVEDVSRGTSTHLLEEVSRQAPSLRSFLPGT